jgi:hypothetical protein
VYEYFQTVSLGTSVNKDKKRRAGAWMPRPFCSVLASLSSPTPTTSRVRCPSHLLSAFPRLPRPASEALLIYYLAPIWPNF